MKASLDRGRYLATESEAAAPATESSLAPETQDGKPAQADGPLNSTELNLQVLQVAAAGGVIKPLKAEILETTEVKQSLRLPKR